MVKESQSAFRLAHTFCANKSHFHEKGGWKSPTNLYIYTQVYKAESFSRKTYVRMMIKRLWLMMESAIERKCGFWCCARDSCFGGTELAPEWLSIGMRAVTSQCSMTLCLDEQPPPLRMMDSERCGWQTCVCYVYGQLTDIRLKWNSFRFILDVISGV